MNIKEQVNLVSDSADKCGVAKVVSTDDAIRIAKEYAEDMCNEQKKICAEGIHNLDWNVMNNDIDAHEALSTILAAPFPFTDKDGEWKTKGETKTKDLLTKLQLKYLLPVTRDKRFSFTAEYKTEPPGFKEYYRETKDGKRNYSFIARPNGINGRKRKAYLIDIHITEEGVISRTPIRECTSCHKDKLIEADGYCNCCGAKQ